MTMPGDDETAFVRQETGKRERWRKPLRCSVCSSAIWLRPVALKEPLEAPEPRQEWVLCKVCHKALLVEMRRSSIRSPVRLRIALGLVAAERSPEAYEMRPSLREQRDFQREFTWFIRFLLILALLHLSILAVLLTVPR